MGDVSDLGHAMAGRPIVVGLDETDTAQRALSAALDLARTLGCPLVVVSAYRRVHDSKLRGARRDAPADVGYRLQGDSHVQMLLEDAREQAEAAGVVLDCVAREGTAANVIVEVAAQRRAGLVVVGNRGMRGGGRLKGSVPNDVSHSAPCSVLIVDTVGAVAA